MTRLGRTKPFFFKTPIAHYRTRPRGNMNTTRLIASPPQLNFSQLVEKWKPFHYLKLELSTQQTYDRRMPLFQYLNDIQVEEITVSTIDDLVSHWVSKCIKSKRRYTFEKELHILKVILNYYRTRINPRYLMPILPDHFDAADVAKRPSSPVQTLSQEQLSLFLSELRKYRVPIFYTLALAEVALGLRIGEACGLNWPAIDLQNKLIRIDWTVVWDLFTWQSRIKERPKNGKIRVLVMPDVLVEELKRLEQVRDPNIPLVFHFNGLCLNRQTVAKLYNRTLSRLGITHVHGTHFLRATAATLANEATGDFYAVSKLLDHSNPNITLRYVAPTNSAKHKVAEALNSVLVTTQAQSAKSVWNYPIGASEASVSNGADRLWPS